MRNFDNVRKLNRGRQRRQPLSPAIGMLALVTLVLAACGQAAPTAMPPTQPPVVAPTTMPPTQPPAVAPTESPLPAALSPSVTVADQAIVDGKVTIAQVVSATPGWLVVHAQKDGKPGEVLGYSPVQEGDNADVVVMIDTAKASGTLYAMLHSDAGTVGTYEFPGADGPVMVGDQMVNPTFQITGGLAAAPSATTPSETAVPPVASGTSPSVAVGEGEVEMEDFQFQPKVLTVRVGTTVKFANKDKVQHTATSDTNVFDSGFLSKGDTFSFTFTEVGEYPYYCAPHGGPGGAGMAGTIIVVP